MLSNLLRDGAGLKITNKFTDSYIGQVYPKSNSE